MRKIKIAFGSIVCLGVFALVNSCKPQPVGPINNEPETPKDTIVTVDYRRNIKLYLPQNTNESGQEYKFYSITKNSHSNSVDSTIELAYVYDDTDGSKHHLGSSAADKIRLNFVTPVTNQTEVRFYRVANNFQTAIFDTLNDVRTIARYFNKLDLNKVTYSGTKALVKSDQFGWVADEIFAFELPNGKRGLILLTEEPSVSYNLDKTKILDGRMVLSIKMEK